MHQRCWGRAALVFLPWTKITKWYFRLSKRKTPTEIHRLISVEISEGFVRSLFIVWITFCLACILLEQELFHHPTGAVTMAARLPSKGDNLAPTTSPVLTFSFSSFVPNNAAFSQKPFKWWEYTLNINNVPTLCVPLIASFCIAKKEIGSTEPLLLSRGVMKRGAANHSIF